MDECNCNNCGSVVIEGSRVEIGSIEYILCASCTEAFTMGQENPAASVTAEGS